MDNREQHKGIGEIVGASEILQDQKRSVKKVETIRKSIW